MKTLSTMKATLDTAMTNAMTNAVQLSEYEYNDEIYKIVRLCVQVSDLCAQMIDKMGGYK